ncbi:hypothetical protein BSQ96_22095 [Serratia proteamaculans]|nr:hypothetical protein BSQ96_22095 [Serratia proteamaculans]
MAPNGSRSMPIIIVVPSCCSEVLGIDLHTHWLFKRYFSSMPAAYYPGTYGIKRNQNNTKNEP